MALASRAQARLDAVRPSPLLTSSPAPEGAYYDADLCPDGTINLSTAENSLLTARVLPHLKYRATLMRAPVAQLADLLPAYVGRRCPARTLDRRNTVCGPGIGALLAQLVWALCDVGDGVALTTPYYHDYDRDIRFPAQAVTVLAPVAASDDPLGPAGLAALRATIAHSAAPVRAILLCNPHNPVPRCYPVSTIEAYIALADELGLHLIVDEVFAHTVFATAAEPSPAPFVSALSLPWPASMRERIHVLASPTKDFGCSALKAGVLVSENAAVRRSVDSALMAAPISGVADAALSELLADDERVDALLAENRRALGDAMDVCAAWADFHALPHVGATAGVYFILDLAPAARRLRLDPADDVASTAALMRRMIACRVHINPTSTLDADPLPCRFRVIFTHPRPTLLLALARIEDALEMPRWPGLEELGR